MWYVTVRLARIMGECRLIWAKSELIMAHDQDISADARISAGAIAMQSSQMELLARLAMRYVWWKSVEDALRYPDRIIAQVMNIGDYDDVQALIEAFGEEALREVVRHAEAGQFNERSWAYWHIRLGLVPPNASAVIPPLPTRSLP